MVNLIYLYLYYFWTFSRKAGGVIAFGLTLSFISFASKDQTSLKQKCQLALSKKAENVVIIPTNLSEIEVALKEFLFKNKSVNSDFVEFAKLYIAHQIADANLTKEQRAFLDEIVMISRKNGYLNRMHRDLADAAIIGNYGAFYKEKKEKEGFFASLKKSIKVPRIEYSTLREFVDALKETKREQQRAVFLASSVDFEQTPLSLYEASELVLRLRRIGLDLDQEVISAALRNVFDSYEDYSLDQKLGIFYRLDTLGLASSYLPKTVHVESFEFTDLLSALENEGKVLGLYQSAAMLDHFIFDFKLSGRELNRIYKKNHKLFEYLENSLVSMTFIPFKSADQFSLEIRGFSRRMQIVLMAKFIDPSTANAEETLHLISSLNESIQAYAFRLFSASLKQYLNSLTDVSIAKKILSGISAEDLKQEIILNLQSLSDDDLALLYH